MSELTFTTLTENQVKELVETARKNFRDAYGHLPTVGTHIVCNGNHTCHDGSKERVRGARSVGLERFNPI